MPVAQLNHETPQRWLHAGALRWATINGLTLGSAFASRIGYPLWYVVPLAALLVGRPLLGAALYALYALVRTGAVYPLLRWRTRTGDPTRVTDALRHLQPVTRRICGASFAVVGAVTFVTFGL